MKLLVKSRAFVESFTDYLPALISITHYALGSILENLLEVEQKVMCILTDKKHGGRDETSSRVFNTLAFKEDLTESVGPFLGGAWLPFCLSIKILLTGFITGPEL